MLPGAPALPKLIPCAAIQCRLPCACSYRHLRLPGCGHTAIEPAAETVTVEPAAEMATVNSIEFYDEAQFVDYYKSSV